MNTIPLHSSCMGVNDECKERLEIISLNTFRTLIKIFYRVSLLGDLFTEGVVKNMAALVKCEFLSKRSCEL